MNYKIIIQPEAEKDLDAAYVWYENSRQELGEEFLNAIDNCLSLIQANPFAYPIIYKQIHRTIVRKFPYGIFYLLKDDAVVVIACLHAKQNPQRLQNRI
ncbi:MAG: type II toxin-antitoxin system RelE/ParE family toxin [Trichodesmium sp. MO_231.B1]|nr:type II toxin-antitoxin system RelE/ParE family toxin [Trichodesmium sp. MO_231.B1]